MSHYRPRTPIGQAMLGIITRELVIITSGILLVGNRLFGQFCPMLAHPIATAFRGVDATLDICSALPTNHSIPHLAGLPGDIILSLVLVALLFPGITSL
ncbi:MAG TPA: hypothetical protein VFA65_24330 [Bryobacteraceae bacterium]|nr:hypothetical protein [Bryobacteraceae bacterium]